ncbi:MAG: Stk1 family PASTA domain-containing Ser/Thr kinase [Actinomycetota bacterium]|nr:Stk1 family PASTA domain-containing Ser/Thr kinase [Actinomycetota bacterium]MDQ3648177.1 Stk1 family PASTA domain-containing Ser/Thr kinase [Actinomycetota bacterium]
MTEVSTDTVVDGRYRIVGRIGSGGMADVYSAEDTHLGRQIALKVLHRRFAQDVEFVERFRREAKSAASLSHPNVVGIFDRGEHEGTYYIAMECLTGRTLKDVVTQEAPLGQERAIDLGLQVLQAAGFAHRHGLIHRDFKPHNVIVDEAGHAKVTDFGIARAGASEMTETGSIMGTAQYLSPEQAQGHPVTAASDLYSIGVMLYEMLAGRLPFEGDSAVSIALKHLNEPPVPLSTLRPDIDPALESVVMAALAKDPSARWQSAEDFAGALEASRGHLLAGGSNGQSTSGWAAVAALPPDDDGYPDAEEPVRKRRRWPWAVLALLVLAMLAVLAYALTRPKMVDVPKVEGQQLEQAREILERAGFEKVKVERSRSLAERDRVLDQDPDPGGEAEENGTITLEVSNGPGDTRVPSVENLPQERAVKELNRVQLKVNLDPEPSNTVREGFAIRTAPPEGTEVERGTRIRLLVSSGAGKVKVPGVIGLLRESAESRLGAGGFDVSVRTEQSDQPKDEVISQTPSAGSSVERGADVTITVSKGRATPEPGEQVSVPSVTGLSASDAAAQLRGAGLSVSRSERPTDDESEDGKVLAQRPGAGADVDPGTSVTIVVGKLEDPEANDPPPGGGGTPQPPPGGTGQ